MEPEPLACVSYHRYVPPREGAGEWLHIGTPGVAGQPDPGGQGGDMSCSVMEYLLALLLLCGAAILAILYCDG